MLKKLLAAVMVLALAMSLCVNVFADGETEIPLDADHVGASTSGSADVLTIENGSIMAATDANVPLFALTLPENVKLGDTITVHIKGSADDDFRVWLLANTTTDEKGSEATFSNQWKGSENGFTAPGEFEKYITLIAEDYDQQGGTEADRLAFKGPSFGVNLSNLKLTYVGIITGGMEEIEESAAQDAQPFLDAANNALAAAESSSDKAALESALSDAEAAVASLEDAASLGFAKVNDMLKEAKSAVSSIKDKLNSANAEEVMAALQGDIDAVKAAKDAATAAGDDIDAIQAALDSANAAIANIDAAASENSGISAVSDALDEAKSSVSEIESALNSAKEAKAAAEEAARIAEEEAAAKKKTTTIIVVVVVAVVVVIAVIVAVILGKKKKK